MFSVIFGEMTKTSGEQYVYTRPVTRDEMFISVVLYRGGGGDDRSPEDCGRRGKDGNPRRSGAHTRRFFIFASRPAPAPPPPRADRSVAAAAPLAKLDRSHDPEPAVSPAVSVILPVGRSVPKGGSQRKSQSGRVFVMGLGAGGLKSMFSVWNSFNRHSVDCRA